ncbi:ChbG/HpnK family deacetylase [Isobaculum melis]|uniref:Predicted glycoside hydrolase or deacetylase ChbG, UPF0249 family n=1 Tax=Isobaculum melis TaxID=142588 RepID=A0A1H9PSF3_9LACT|nr:ChbG/HpnK family deacetylase [Isobaculum melis]SER51157.1 Predicted glycoside hydrolase or deacetylase ChbG, UPF0249 family [Isobaculum melis]
MSILIRADDLGYSEAVNYGIAKSVIDGIVNNVGVMVNMPASEHGLALLKNETVCYGCHTNICVGKPLTDPKLIPSITTADGSFKPSKEYRQAKEDFVVLEEVLLEIEAQYHKFVELTGQQPQYFEGHAVESPNVVKGLQMIAEKYQLKFSGFSFEGGSMQVNKTKVYVLMDSMFPAYDPLESLKKLVKHPHQDGVDMMILHPGYLDDFILKTSSLTIPRTKEVAMAISPEAKELLRQSKTQQLTYDDL